MPSIHRKKRGVFMARKIKETYYLTISSVKWLSKEAEREGLSKSTVIQLLINKAMAEKPSE